MSDSDVSTDCEECFDDDEENESIDENYTDAEVHDDYTDDHNDDDTDEHNSDSDNDVEMMDNDVEVIDNDDLLSVSSDSSTSTSSPETDNSTDSDTTVESVFTNSALINFNFHNGNIIISDEDSALNISLGNSAFMDDTDWNDANTDSDIDTDTDIDTTRNSETASAILANTIENNTLTYEYKVVVNNSNNRSASVQCDNNHNVMDNCSICFSTFADKEMVRRLPCFHLYHKDCIDQWFRSGHRKLCPICRHNIYVANRSMTT